LLLARVFDEEILHSGYRITDLGEIVGLLSGPLSDVGVHRDSQAEASTMRLDTHDADASRSGSGLHDRQRATPGVTAPSPAPRASFYGWFALVS